MMQNASVLLGYFLLSYLILYFHNFYVFRGDRHKKLRKITYLVFFLIEMGYETLIMLTSSG